MTPAAPAAAASRLAAHWRLRAGDAVSAYLPLLLMALLALGTWWLVKNTPLFEAGPAAAPARHEPDYTMTGFVIQRYAPGGALRVQIDGAIMRHYPDTETYEIDDPRIRSVAEDGRVTRASAKRAIANKDGSEVQLLGDAHVVREAAGADPAIDFRSEFLHYFQYTERVQTHLPVTVTRGGSTLQADSMRYDNLTHRLDLKGRVRSLLLPPGAAAPKP